VSAIDERKLRLTDASTNHTTEALLASSVPELETDLDTIHGNFLCYKKSTGSGCGVLGVVFVLSVSLQEAGLAHALLQGTDYKREWFEGRRCKTSSPLLPITTTLASIPWSYLDPLYGSMRG
jgi:hypothetical protein